MQPIDIKDIPRIIDHSVDHFLCSASFEERCFRIPQNMPHDRVVNIAVFCNSDFKRFYKNHIENILDGFKTSKSQTIDLDTNDPGKNASSVLEYFESIEGVAEKNIVVDITTFTHETLLVLLKILRLKKIPLNNIEFAYNNADDYSINEVKIEDKWLSKGIGYIRNVIGYSGFMNPLKKNHLIVMVGIEEDRTKTLINKLEPNTLSLGVSHDQCAISNAAMRINLEKHKKLCEMFLGSESFEFTTTDPLEVEKILSIEIGRHPTSNIILAPMNNKISTVGAGLFALKNPNIQVCYATALQYNIPGYSTPSNKCCIFKLV